jgi:hypothetical protein
MYKNPKVINELGGIVMEAIEDGEPDRYLDPVLDAIEHKLAMKGKYGAVTPFTPPSEQEVLEQLAAQGRAQRDSLLASTDWTQLPDVPQATREAYAVYRQALRDVPQQDGFPLTITWPEHPHG